MKTKNLSRNSKGARAETLERAERDMNQAKLAAKQAKLEVKLAKKTAKEARKRFKTARKAYKSLLKAADKHASRAKKVVSSSDNRKRPAAQETVPLPAALLPRISRSKSKANSNPAAKRVREKVAPEPSMPAAAAPAEPQVLPDLSELPVGLPSQNPGASDVRAPGP